MSSDKSIPTSESQSFRQVHTMDQEILETLISTRAINFEAIGQTISKVGASSVFVDDGWIRWCGSDLRIHRWPGPRLELERLATIRELAQGGFGR
jgi:hypothetical protein